MVANCANPECGAPFRYFRDGRLFRFDLNHHFGPRYGRTRRDGSPPGRILLAMWLLCVKDDTHLGTWCWRQNAIVPY